jgi:hypothetical protein
MLSEVERRITNEEKLSGFQRKKGAILFGAIQKELRTGTPVAYKVVEAIEDKEVEEIVEIADEQGQPERVRTKRIVKVEKTGWAFGIITGVAPSIDSRGLHGTGYEITNDDGSVITVPRDAIITQEMHNKIKYYPTLLLVYNGDDPIMVVLYTWDSLYLPCPILRNTIRDLLDDSFLEYIDNQKGYEVNDFSLTVKVTDANKNVHAFGPMECSLFQNSDCRGCLANLLNYSDAGWDVIRGLAKDLCGRGTMYMDGNFVIRRGVSRELFIRFIEVEKWARTRDAKYLDALLEAVLDYQEKHGEGLPQHQLDALSDIIKERMKEEYATIKKDGNSAAIEEFKELKKQITANLKKMKPYEESDVVESDIDFPEVDEGEESIE